VVDDAESRREGSLTQNKLVRKDQAPAIAGLAEIGMRIPGNLSIAAALLLAERSI
jgi:hypothetical protein